MWHHYWHPTEASWRPVQISLFVETQNGFVHETELAAHADDLIEYTGIRPGPGYHPGLSGAISLITNQVEILGTKYWVYDFEHLGTGSASETFNGGANTMNLEHTDTRNLNITLNTIDGHTAAYTLDSLAFRREWILMRARAERVREALGDKAGAKWLKDWRFGWPQAVRVPLQPELVDYTCETPLQALLADPIPKRFTPSDG